MSGPSSPQAPQPIRRLDDAVVNRIAAGEVIARPASALKEMIENSIDAGASQITILVKEGGTRMLQIQDNGHGVQLEDLPILCERHTTSKLREFEDLETIQSLGFRGEALCSISFVSHMTVTTMLHGANYGHRVTYKDGAMDPAGPRPVAAVPGTTICVEDLYYNVPMRKKALRSATEEYSHVLDIVSRYAIFTDNVAFSCKRQGEAKQDVSTLAGSSRRERVRAVYGAAVARSLLDLDLELGPSVGPEVGLDAGMALRLKALVSDTQYSGRRTQLLLFINGRPVDCPPLRRALEGAYAALLPKNHKPFMFMDLRLPPRHVEVNVHPTKSEVGFLHQDEVVAAVRDAVEARLTSSADTRTFATATLPLSALPAPPSATPPPQQPHGNGNGNGTGNGAQSDTPQTAAYRPERLVRVDHRSQTMDAFLSVLPPKTEVLGAALHGSVAHKRRRLGDRAAPINLTEGADQTPLWSPTAVGGVSGGTSNASAGGLGLSGGADGECAGDDDDDEEEEEDATRMFSAPSARAAAPAVTQRPNPRQLSELSSVRELWADVELTRHHGLADAVKEGIFVGLVDPTLMFLQHGTRLYLVDLTHLSKDLFYQQVLRRLDQVEVVPLSAPLPVADLMELALDLEEARGNWQPEVGSKGELSSLVVRLVRQKAAMLRQYFGLDFSDDGAQLRGLPLLVDGWVPAQSWLPDFVLSLARDVEWEQERPCLHTLALAIADLYRVHAPPPSAKRGRSTWGDSAARTSPEADDVAGPSAKADGGVEELGNVISGRSILSAPATAAAGSMEKQEEEALAAGQRPEPQVPWDYGNSAQEKGRGGRKAAGQGVGGEGEGDAEEEDYSVDPQHVWQVKHVVLPAMRRFLWPQMHRAGDGSFLLITQLERLYRVFERC